MSVIYNMYVALFFDTATTILSSTYSNQLSDLGRKFSEQSETTNG